MLVVGKIFGIMVVLAIISALISGNMAEISNAALSGAKDAVTLSISLLGAISLWSGILSVLDKAGVTSFISKISRPILKKIYSNTQNFDNISLNFSANLLGLGNAALPLGIKAAKDINFKMKTSANDDLIMFSVLNTTPLQLFPTTLIALRSSYGSQNPFDVIMPIWICSVATTVFAIIVCKSFAKIFK